jgi:hypothetical protein
MIQDNPGRIYKVQFFLNDTRTPLTIPVTDRFDKDKFDTCQYLQTR